MSRKQIDLGLLKSHLQQIDITSEEIHVPGAIGHGDLEEAYHLSAAVLTTFDLSQLRPFGRQESGPKEAAFERLLANCSLRYDDQGRRRWSLNYNARKQALARLHTRERLQAALETTETRPDDHLQTLFEAYLYNTAEPPAQQSLADLRHTLQIIDWLSDTELAAGLPPRAEVQARVAWEELLHPFRYLVGEGFHGREEVLAELYQHVTGAGARPPLLIFGPGGVGKSTLLAEFVLQQTDRKPPSERLPFTYVDFDQASIDAGEPLTIVTTAARQLAIQFPAAAAAYHDFVQEWSYRLAAEGMRAEQNILVEQQSRRDQAGDYMLGPQFEKMQPRAQFRKIDWYLGDFQALLEQTVPGNRPWLLVLDTFEEVQLHSRDLVAAIGHFLLTMRDWIPQARVIVAGRAHAEELSAVPLELEGFDEEAAVAFLYKQGVTSPTIARRIFQAVTGNPLSLKLAARVIKQEGLADDADPAALQNLLRKVAEGNIQGQLYRRVLDHINDADVRKLAHPGLTLRLITPELIEQVLAGPCEVAVRPGTDDAQRLFNLLSKEVGLVTPAGYNVLRHRPDVRAVMIAALHNDRPLVVHAIHQAAVAYYEQRDGPENRAEEIYHRLFVERDFNTIERRWQPHFHEILAQQLRPALGELMPRARAWLATRLRLTGVEGVNWDETDLPQWEIYVEQRARDLIQSNDWEGALALLAERRERSVGSRLYFLETVILRRQERWLEARRAAYEGIYSLKVAGDEVRLLDLLRQAIVIDRRLDHTHQAQAGLAQARELLAAQPYADQTVALELDMMELKLAREQEIDQGTRVEELRAAILERFLRMSDRELLAHPELIRDAVLEFGSENLQVLRRGLNLMTLGEPTAEQRRELAKVLFLWDLDLSRTVGQAPGVLLREVGGPEHPDLAAGWQTYVQHNNAHVLNKDVDRLLERYGRVKSTVVLGLDALGEATPGIRPVAVGDTGVNISGSVIATIIAGEKQ
jgi:cellulose synthase operon protein C